MQTLVYTLPECQACQTAKALLAAGGEDFREIAIDNPLTELGVRSLFKDGGLHAPIVLRSGRGAFVLSGEEPPRLLRMVAKDA